MNVRELAYEWLDDRSRSVEPSSYDQYKRDVDTFIVPLVGDSDVESFTHTELQQFVYATAEMETKASTKKHPQKYSQRTIDRAARTMKSILRFGAIVGYMPAIAYDVRRPRAHDYHQSKKIKYLREKDAKRVLARIIEIVEHPDRSITDPYEKAPLADISSNRRYALGCILGIAGGLRIGEVCAVKRACFDFDHNTLDVASAVRTYKGKDADTYTTEDGPTKTVKSTRIIPLQKAHIDLFEEYSPKGYLIPGGMDKKSVAYKRGFSGWFKRFITAEGFPSYSFHSLRHTYATRLIKAGVDIKTVSELLGHSDVTTTARIYVHVDEDSKADAANKLEW